MIVYEAPEWAPKLPDRPDHIPIGEFILNPAYGRVDPKVSNHPYVCGITGKSYSVDEVVERVEYAARAIKQILKVQDIHKGGPQTGFSEWEKVVGVFSVNCVDYLTLCYTVHRINGITSPASAAYSASELAYQLRDSQARVLFTCTPLLDTALEAAKAAGIPKENIFLLPVPDAITTEEMRRKAHGFKNFDDLVEEGKRMEKLVALRWDHGFSRKKIAFVSYSSGTSGLPKGVLISHFNMITNVLQMYLYSQSFREFSKPSNVLALLPQSHIYALVVINQTEPYAGNSAVILPKFDLSLFLTCIQRFKLAFLFLVPPLVIVMAKNKAIVDKYDISSVKYIMTGAAPLTEELSKELNQLYPGIKVVQGYGLTESSTVVCYTSGIDIWHGSSGCILPGIKCRIVNAEGRDVGEGEPGELLISADNVVLGYLNNQKANDETFITEHGARWLRTGDETIIKRSPAGNQHVFIVDRLKELIKTSGHQVAPAELEGHLLNHEKVADCAVIPVPHETAGETAKAYVVLKPGVAATEQTKLEIMKWVADHKSRYKRLGGGVEFTDIIPKSPSGKILRRLLRDKEKERRRAEGAKL
ncbi:S-dihydroxybenzoyltransferase [Drechslerella dactyloides]|uniref:S-dihydroxybenzoyltransferase n=1 Tax=Drechslerella dactyloides TaxID=74499 RepID=A0AAD6NGN9_DREDA|nr:S-dihydroxybenzoyltransferase [Drechslerella dactyloides]